MLDEQGRLMPRCRWLLFRVFCLLAYLAFVCPLPAIAGDTAPIQTALKESAVVARARPIAMGFREPMVSLFLENQSEVIQVIQVPAGTTLTPSLDGFSRLVTLGSGEISLEPLVETQIDLVAYSLDYQANFPSKMKEVEYSIEAVDPAFVELLNQIETQNAADSWAAQFAIWSQNSGKSLDELVVAASKYPVADYLDQARQIMGIVVDTPTFTIEPSPIVFTETPVEPEIVAQAPVSQSPNYPAEVVSEKPKDKKVSGAVYILIFVAIIVVALVVALVLSLRDKPADAQPAGEVESPLTIESPFVKVEPVKITEKPTREHLKTKTKSEAVGAGLASEETAAPAPMNIRLKGLTGPYQEKVLNLILPCVISRGNLVWLTIDDASVSTPHAVFDFSNLPYRVKDLNSKNGVLLDDVKQERGFKEVKEGQHIRLGRCAFLVTPTGMTLIEGVSAPKVHQAGDDLLLVSRQEARVLVTGDQDKRISDAHVILYEKDQAVYARDLHSTNGTIVNQVRIQTDTVLKSKDHLILGMSEFEVLI